MAGLAGWLAVYWETVGAGAGQARNIPYTPGLRFEFSSWLWLAGWPRSVTQITRAPTDLSLCISAAAAECEPGVSTRDTERAAALCAGYQIGITRVDCAAGAGANLINAARCVIDRVRGFWGFFFLKGESFECEGFGEVRGCGFVG